MSSGVLLLGIRGKTYFLQSGNVMKNENVKLIKDRIDYLNTLDKTQIRKYYKEQIQTDNLNPISKGAGLGLIEIARRASSKIESSFTPQEGDFTFLQCTYKSATSSLKTGADERSGLRTGYNPSTNGQKSNPKFYNHATQEGERG